MVWGPLPNGEAVYVAVQEGKEEGGKAEGRGGGGGGAGRGVLKEGG